MPSASTLAAFAGASLVLLAIPGPAVLFIVARSVQHGRRAGVISASAVAAGNSVHVLAAAAGLTALIAASATAFTAVKIAGAGYLLWLALSTARRPSNPESAPDTVPTRNWTVGRLWREGALVATFNPKTALFFLAFLPQFVQPAAGPAAAQIVVLGTSFVLLGLCTDSTWALVTGRLAGRLRVSTRARALQEWITSGIYGTLGLFALRSSRHAS